jgi:hypothetical protein
MTKIEELEAISRFLLQEMAEMPSFVTLGTRAYAQMNMEFEGRGRYFAGQMSSGPARINQVNLSAGSFTVFVDPNVNVDKVSIGTMSIGDVLPSLRFFKTLDRLGLPTPISIMYL